MRAAHAEAQAQLGPAYFCPACGCDADSREALRAHLEQCPDYREFVAASVRRPDLEENRNYA